MGAQSIKFMDTLDPQALKDALLLEAARDNGAVSAMLASGANPNTRDASGATPLHLAAANGHTDALKTLVIRGGADLNAQDTAGKTALHYAAAKGRQAAINTLIELGAKAPGASAPRPASSARVQVVPPGQTRVRVKVKLKHDPALLPAFLHLNASSAIH